MTPQQRLDLSLRLAAWIGGVLIMAGAVVNVSDPGAELALVLLMIGLGVISLLITTLGLLIFREALHHCRLTAAELAAQRKGTP